MGRVDNLRYLGSCQTEDSPWSFHIDTLVKKTCQHLCHLRCLKDTRLPLKVLKTSSTFTIGSIQTGSITPWFVTEPRGSVWPCRGWCAQQNAPSHVNSQPYKTFIPGGAGRGLRGAERTSVTPPKQTVLSDCSGRHYHFLKAKTKKKKFLLQSWFLNQ